MTAAQDERLPQTSMAVAGQVGREREPFCLNNFHANGNPIVGAAADSTMLRDTRVLIVDDCTPYREYLAAVMAAHGAPVTGVAWDLPSLLSALDVERPQVLLINMTTQNWCTLLRQAQLVDAQVRVVATGVAEDDESPILACAEAGVAGYHMRSDSLQDLLKLIERVGRGETLCSPGVSAILLQQFSTLAAHRQVLATELVLTDREDQILEMLELGLSNRDIAERLHIAVHTVKNHVHSLLNKLGVESRAQAAAVARSRRTPTGVRRN